MRLGRARYWFLGVGGAALVVLVLIALTFPLTSDALRHRIVQTLEEKLDSKIELGDFHATIFPTLHAEGSDLTIRLHGRTDVPPLITIKSFSVDAGLVPLLRKHVTRVAVTGLNIQIPPDHNDNEPQPRPDAVETAVATAGRSPAPTTAASDDTSGPKGVVIDELRTTDASLVLIPGEPDKAPKVWSIHALTMTNVGAATRMPFDATLTNGVPPGEIATSGTFGPWNADRPAATPLNGTFTFDDANLAVFTGVFGTLSAKGTFGGALGRIDIHGDTTTPDFGLTTALHPVPLEASYHSIVDGMNGDTILERIDAKLLKTSIVAKGAVTGHQSVDGRLVTLDVAIENGRLEDILRLAVKTPKPVMVGALTLTTKFILPPGPRDVVEKLRLNGRFDIAHARFTDPDVTKKLAELSQRSRGKPGEAPPARVDSEFKGQFALGNAALTIPNVEFAVPGATVKLAGRYGLKSERLDFQGNLLMAAKVSETMTGIKRVLLKLADPLFKRDGGGSSVPIKVTGTRNKPEFGLDKGRIFHR